VSLENIPGVVHASPEVHADERGWFTEVMRAQAYPEQFVQSNHSHSEAGVLRGLHYHRRQADLWYVVSGHALVGLADLRTRSDSPATATVVLAGDRPAALYIPAGVAHGFLAVEAVDLLYWVTNYYDASDEHGVAWNDPTLAIDWGATAPVLSDRDSSNPELQWDDIPPFT
jgi:dTDP-4-dehydrorhamnose 3,5-epimerase